MLLLHAIILAVVEGLTEYLPISSTGHIILTSAAMGIEQNQFVKDYTVMVQFGAIMSVVVIYWRRFFQSIDFYKKLALGFLPAGVLGLLLKNHIDALLGSVVVVAWALVIGGVVLIFIDRWQPKNKTTEISYKNAILIGCVQCLAFIPGVSRAAATIIGGLTQGLDRKHAAEFSFFLAVPTLSGAGLIKLIKVAPHITQEHIQSILIGNIVSFIVGWLTIKAFMLYLTKYGFKQFGWYRVIVGTLLLILVYSGFSLKML